MDQITNEELIELAKKIGIFFVQLKANGIPEELASQLTRDYFNYNLSQDDDDDEDAVRVPNSWLPFSGLEYRTG